MTRVANGSPLPRTGGWFVPVIALFAAAVIAEGIAAALDRPGAAIMVGVLALVLIAATIALRLRAGRHTAMADLFVIAVTPVLGWPEPDRSRVLVRAWRGGWFGTPRKIRLSYNTVASVEGNAL